jgi:hypothetical protein
MLLRRRLQESRDQGHRASPQEIGAQKVSRDYFGKAMEKKFRDTEHPQGFATPKSKPKGD